MPIGMSSIATSALQNAQIGLRTTGNNIANANTPGYSRQVIVQTSNSESYTSGVGWVGNGASVAGIERVSSSYLNAKLNGATSALSSSTALQQQLEGLSNLMSNFDTGVSSAMSDFYASANALAGDPSTSTYREGFVNSSNGLASRLNDIGGQLKSTTLEVGQRITQTVGDINSITKQLADLNAKAGASLSVGSSNEFKDKRDALVASLSSKIGVQVTESSNGSFSAYMGNGQPLVLGDKSFSLSTANNSTDPELVDVSYKIGTKDTVLDSGAIGGGELNGLLNFRDGALVQSRNELGRVTIAFADAVNKQNRLGSQPNGQQGGDIFTIQKPQVFANSSNAGNAIVSGVFSDTTKLTSSDYEARFDGANWSVTNKSTQAITTSSTLPISVDGMSFSVSAGSAVAGDKFSIKPTRNAADTIALRATSSEQIASGSPVNAKEALANKGSAAVFDASATTDPWDANLKTPASIVYGSGLNFSVNGTNVTAEKTPQGYSIQANGWKVELRGTPVAGDTFAVNGISGVGDGRNANKIADIDSKAVVSGSLTPSAALSQMVSKIGSQTREVSNGSTSAQAILTSITEEKSSISGVNLDEEATNMLKYQQAYQAAAKLIAASGAMFDSIMAVVGR